MPKLNERNVALSLGILFAVLHAIEIVLISATKGSVLKFLLDLHFVSLSYSVAAFSATNAVLGIALAFVAGAVVGWLFAVIWNRAVKIK